MAIRLERGRGWSGNLMRAVGLIVLIGLAAGCTRAHYRKSADRETYPEIRERECTPWAVPRISVDPPAESRLYDPFDPDHPPMPPDDPAAHKYMHCVDGIRA